eukprot:Seg1477.16 transcript_id=Seg1477.16/GoldUCD/mRNA.D3Y31 product="Anaphase-promoting complex subunit 5" protein_id=Seg1477.16/GoldUCD/D3Y31
MMDSLSIAKEKIYPHQVACLVLIFHSCKDDDPPISNVLTFQMQKFKRQVVLLLLDLIQRVQLDYDELLRKLETATSTMVTDSFSKRIGNMTEDRGIGILDFFDSLEPLTLSGNHYLQRNSLFGIFVRRLYLNYQKMTFTDTGELGKSLVSYIKDGQVRANKNVSTSSDGNRYVHVFSMEMETDISESETSTKAMNTLSQAGRFIAQQTRLLESQSPNSLSPRELQKKIQDIIQKFPTVVDAYYLSYLNYLQIGEVRNALFDLHRYFDYKKWEEEQSSSNEETEKTSIEKHQMKFKRFRYCALNLGIFHFTHGHYGVSLAALEEAIKMAQETNDKDCLLHALFWLHQLKSDSGSPQAKSMLAQFCRKAKELGALEMQGLGCLLQCKSDAFSGDSTIQEVQSRLNELDSANAIRSGIFSSRKIQVARSALLDYYGHRPVALHSSQLALYDLKNNHHTSCNEVSSFESSDPESFILALCQTAKYMADEGFVSDAHNILHFGTSLIVEHSQLQKWIILCKWQLIFDRCVFTRNIESAKDAMKQIRVLDKDDANLRECIALFLSGNIMIAASKIDNLIEDAAKRQQITIGNTPKAIYQVRLLQLKAELFSTTENNEKAVSCLIKAIDICRKSGLETLESELSISLAQCKIFLGLPSQAKTIISQRMVHILAYGTLYSRSLAFFVLAKASIWGISKSDMLQLLPLLEKSLEGFHTLDAIAAETKVLCLMAQIYNELEYTTKRNNCAKEFRKKNEMLTSKHPMKLFL